MVAIAQNFVAHVGQIHVHVDGIGAVAAVGLEEFVPDQDAVLVAQVVEILAGALADPVADHGVIGLLVHADLRFEAGAGDAFHRLVHAPVAALAHDRNAVDGKGEVSEPGTS